MKSSTGTADVLFWLLELKRHAIEGYEMSNLQKSRIEQTIENFRLFIHGKKFKTIYADPPWQFQNRTGKVAPEHKRLSRYETMNLEDIKRIPVNEAADEKCHLYLWIPNALLPEGLEVMKAWGFEYKTNIIWEKVRKDGMPDGRRGRLLF